MKAEAENKKDDLLSRHIENNVNSPEFLRDMYHHN